MPLVLYLQVCPVLPGLYQSAMSNATYDAAFVQEVVKGSIIQNYIVFATLAVFIYDTGKPLLIFANSSDSELVLALDKEVRI